MLTKNVEFKEMIMGGGEGTQTLLTMKGKKHEGVFEKGE